MSGAPRAKTSPLRATVPLSCVTKQSGLRSPGALTGDFPKATTMRRTASLDTIYLKGLFPKGSVFYHRERAPQTERASSLESLSAAGAVEERMGRLAIRSRRRSCSKDEKGDYGTTSKRLSPLLKSSAIPPKSSRNSEEGLNQELELYASAEPLQCDRLEQPIPEGRRAPIVELIRERPFSNLRHSANHHSSEDSQSSSPDLDRVTAGSSPQINRFSSRAPPDGCERVLSKSVPILRPIPREGVSSHLTSPYTLKPSCHSAFETLQRDLEQQKTDKEEEKEPEAEEEKESENSPKVPDDHEDP